MPYKEGNDIFCCISPGSRSFSNKPTDFDKLHNITPVVSRYQPWNLVRLNNGVVYPIRHHLPMNSPFEIFCSPVVTDGVISFVYNRCLYVGALDDDKLVDYHIIAEKVFSGYVSGLDVALVYSPCKTGSPQIVLNGQAVNTCLDYVLRVVPYDGGHIITGQKDGVLLSVLYRAGEASRITANREDVYKCHLDGATVIHAKRQGEFEQRFLYQDQATLSSMPGFIV